VPEDSVGLSYRRLYFCALRPKSEETASSFGQKRLIWYVHANVSIAKWPFRTFRFLFACKRAMQGVPCRPFALMRLVIFVHLSSWFCHEVDIIIQETIFHVAKI